MFVQLLVSLLVIFIIIYVVKNIKKEISVFVSLKQLPEPPSTSLIWGSVEALFLDTPENVFKTARKWARTYYPIYNVRVAHINAANIVNPYDFETILTNMKHNTKSPVYYFLHDWLGTGLLTSEGSKWQSRRKVLTPAFHFNILQEFIKIFHDETERLVKLLQKECDKPYISVTEYISDFALNTIGETAMGTNFDDPNKIIKCKEYKNAIHGMGKILLYKLFRPWLLNKFVYYFTSNYSKETKLVNTLHEFTTDVISKREKNFKVVDTTSTYSKRKRLAMLDLLLTAKQEDASINDEGIREEVDTFMFEGHDTTSVSICYTLMLLACHRDIQDKIFEEIQDILQEDTKPDYNSLQNLKYMEGCIKESLRLYPSVHFISRILGEDITTYSGHKLKAGSITHLHIYDVHRNPDIYPDPEKFDPDRFLPENCKERHNFAYVPFSAGPRNCIGQKFAILEIKTVLCGILRHFVLEAVDTPDTITLTSDLVLRPKNSIRVKFVPRK